MELNLSTKGKERGKKVGTNGKQPKEGGTETQDRRRHALKKSEDRPGLAKRDRKGGTPKKDPRHREGFLR